jgi:hypothetical protein
LIKRYNDRNVYLGQRFQVYRNLNTPNSTFFSLKDKKTGLVAAHGNCFKIENVKCHVGKGRFKVREQKRKAVHAWLEGDYADECNMDISQLQEVYYEPYTLDHFVNKETGETLEYIDMVYFCDGKCYMN